MRKIKELDIQQDQRGRYIVSRSGRKIYERPCRHCGDRYFYARSDQKYCAESCRVTAYRKRKESKDEVLSLTPVPPKRPFGKLGSLTGSELGDDLRRRGRECRNGVRKGLTRIKSPELKALERLEQKLDTKPVQLPINPNQQKFQFTGFSEPLRLTDGTVTTVTEVLIDGRAYYLDNGGNLYRWVKKQLLIVHK